MTQPVPNQKAIQDKNMRNLKALPDGGKIAYLYITLQVGTKTEPVLLIGDGHDAKLTNRVKQAKPLKGTIDIGKGGAFSAGELTVTGCTDGKDAFKKIIARFSKKKVTFK